MPDDALRRRIAAALDASIDRCARCKTCDTQVDAVMAVLEAEETELSRRIGDLRAFEREYRSRLDAYLEAALKDLRSGR